MRGEAYGRDVGQHSWVTAEEMESAIAALSLGRDSTVLDIGCGPGGPLTFVVERTGCGGVGLDSSAEAVEAAKRRVPPGVSILRHDANRPLPFEAAQFDAVMSIDAVLHLRDRAALFGEVKRVLVQGGRFWFTDAAVLAGPVSNEEIAARAPLGLTHFVPAGYSEAQLRAVGFVDIETVDRTDGVVRNASGRIAARLRHRADVEAVEGSVEFDSQQRYLEAVVLLAKRRALARMLYIATAP
jgi:SAM-dependent methyltransferase